MPKIFNPLLPFGFDQTINIVAGTDITIDNTDPLNPIVNSTASGGGANSIDIVYTRDGRMGTGGGFQALNLGGSVNRCWGVSGVAQAGVVCFTAPFSGTITGIRANIFEVNMNVAPGASNNVTVAMQFHSDFWNTGGNTLGAEFALPLGPNIGNFTGWQQIGPNGQGANLTQELSIPVIAGEMIGLTLVNKFTTTQALSIGDVSLDVVYTGGVAGVSAGFSVGAARDFATVTNTYLRLEDGLPTNVTPITLPYDCTLIALTATTQSTETWTAEVHSALTLIPGALLSVVAASSGFTNTLSIDFTAGDQIQLFANGTDLSSPRMFATFIRR